MRACACGAEADGLIKRQLCQGCEIKLINELCGQHGDRPDFSCEGCQLDLMLQSAADAASDRAWELAHPEEARRLRESEKWLDEHGLSLDAIDAIYFSNKLTTVEEQEEIYRQRRARGIK